jgi:Zn-dependent M28 family amino/carboxypeptidase
LQTAIDRDLSPKSMLLPDTKIALVSDGTDARRGQSANVVGRLEGSDPQLRRETILITAHYDHLGMHNGRIYPGANDNASGSVGVMELARLFAQDSVRPRRSLLFVVFGSEEEGLLGSYYYVAHPLYPLAATRAVLNLDMIARDETHIPQSQGVVEIPADTRNEINLVGAFYSPDLEATIRKANEKVGLEISTKFDRDHDLNALFRCDHFPFLLHDVPAIWLFGGWHPGYHEPSDTIDRLDFPKLEKVVRLAYESARSLADAPSTPRFQAAAKSF